LIRANNLPFTQEGLFMGLDLNAEPAAKPGYEAEWRGIIERSFRNERLSDAEIARFQEISIESYENVGAPRVGFDAAADAWIIDAQGATTPAEQARVLDHFRGHYALPLVKCDGLPLYTHANLYEGVDETSFRGEFLRLCTDIVGDNRIAEAWDHKLPDDAVRYGRALLAAADHAEAGGPPPPKAPMAAPEKKGLLARIFGKAPPVEPDPVAWDEQLRIVRAAGRWYIFWGERGHPIRAFF
jgi:hypothetical protein